MTRTDRVLRRIAIHLACLLITLGIPLTAALIGCLAGKTLLGPNSEEATRASQETHQDAKTTIDATGNTGAISTTTEQSTVVSQIVDTFDGRLKTLGLIGLAAAAWIVPPAWPLPRAYRCVARKRK